MYFSKTSAEDSVVGCGEGTYDVFHWERILASFIASGDRNGKDNNNNDKDGGGSGGSGGNKDNGGHSNGGGHRQQSTISYKSGWGSCVGNGGGSV